MKPLATWNVKDGQVRWHGSHRGAARYRVKLWIKKGDASATREITPKKPVTLRELLEAVIQHQVDELLVEIPNPTDMGFEVYVWR